MSRRINLYETEACNY